MPSTQKKTSSASQEKLKTTNKEPASQLRMLAGILLIVAGIITLAQQLTGYSIWQYCWPFILIVVGIFIIRRWK